QALLPGTPGRELRGDVIERERHRTGREDIRNGADLVHRVLRPGPRLAGGNRRGLVTGIRSIRLYARGQTSLLGLALAGDVRILELRAQPANVAARFLRGAFGVEGNEALENRLIEGAFGVFAGRGRTAMDVTLSRRQIAFGVRQLLQGIGRRIAMSH